MKLITERCRYRLLALLLILVLLLSGCGGVLAETTAPVSGTDAGTSALPESTPAATNPAATSGQSPAATSQPLPPETTDTVAGAVDPEKPMVALTYDDGPNGDNTIRIVDALTANGGRATFFVVGSRLERESNAKALKYAAEAGCEIGTHTQNHPRMWDLDADSLQKELEECVAAVTEVTDTEVRLFRPTGGNMPDFVSDCGYPLILWNVDTEDWKNRDKDLIVQNIKDNVSDGSIILMHDLYSCTAEATEEILPWLVEQGYQLVTVSELFAARNVVPVSGEVWGRVRPQKRPVSATVTETVTVNATSAAPLVTTAPATSAVTPAAQQTTTPKLTTAAPATQPVIAPPATTAFDPTKTA